MRTIKALSPSALKTWETDREAFYYNYLSEIKNPRQAQTAPMAVGSAFDAFVKSSLYTRIYGKPDSQFEFQSIFEEQVEPDCRTFAFEAGEHCFDRYKWCGAYDELLELLLASEAPPRFEFTLTGKVGDIPLLGKPDCWFVREGVGVLLDWKVSGYCGRSATSPKKGYVTCRDAWDATQGKATRVMKNRLSFTPVQYAGMTTNGHPLEDSEQDWGDQLSIYSWMLGCAVGDDSYVVAIDQLACKPGENNRPMIRVAQIRSRISAFWQFSLASRIQSCWNNIQAGHIFTDVSLEESQAMCEVLDMQDFSRDDDFTASLRQRGYRG